MIIRTIPLIVVVILSLTTIGNARLPGNYTLDAPVDPNGRLASNSVIDLIPHGSSLWMGTGQGLTELHLALPNGGWTLLDEEDGLGRGGISAIVVNDTIMIAATAFSENTSSGVLPAGGGIGFSLDNGATWEWLEQPKDSADIDYEYSPTTTHIQNLIYDISLSDSSIWIASYGGGLRHLTYENFLAEDYTWEIVTPDSNVFNALAYYNHRLFSTVYHDGHLWVGTAAGINHSTDEGRNWENHKFSSTVSGTITGNFVTAMDVQVVGNRTIYWAATWKTVSSESYGVCYSRDNGMSWWPALWDSTLINDEYIVDVYGSLRAHNFGFRDSTVYVAADGGLWISNDFGQTWGEGPLDLIIDETIGERLEGVDFYSVAPVGDSLWVGTDDGIAVGWKDPGSGQYHWRIIRAHKTAGSDGEPGTYAYPSPFSPRRGHITRFQIPVNSPVTASYNIYNFAMEKVYSSPASTLPGGGAGMMDTYGALKWNGRDASGRFVANGVYFYRIKADGDEWWGKVMVLD